MTRKDSDSKFEKRSTTLNVILYFLLEVVIPKNRTQYRAWLQAVPSSWTVDRFFGENAMYIKDNFKPRERAVLYKKLDSLPEAYRCDRARPEGYRLAGMFDYYVSRTTQLYDRALWQAEQQTQRMSAKFDPWLNSFMHDEYGTIKKPSVGPETKPEPKVKAYTYEPGDDESRPDIKFNKDGSPRKPYPKGFCYEHLDLFPNDVRRSVHTRTKWTDQMKAYFIYARTVQNKTEREIADEMGLTKGQVDGAVGRYLKGYFYDIQEAMLDKMPN